jgi:putative addiction module killer protein
MQHCKYKQNTVHRGIQNLVSGTERFTGKSLVVLLCGGDKSTQEEDIRKAKEILKELENETH